jgi:hypothetical protein
MTTQKEILAAAAEVHTFLASKADRTGKIALNQKELAKEYGITHVRFHRLIQRLLKDGDLRVIGRGARGALTVAVVGGNQTDPLA